MSQESDINYLIVGLLLGGIIAGLLGFLIPYIDIGTRLGIGGFGSLIDVGLSYWLAF